MAHFLKNLCNVLFKPSYWLKFRAVNCDALKRVKHKFVLIFFKNGLITSSFSVYFRLFNLSQFKFKFKLIKA